MTPEQLAKSGTEHGHQRALFAWAAKSGIPELSLMFAIPNGGLRDPRTAAKLKAEGVKSGVPDIFLPVARHGVHGLFIELKKPKKGRASDNQSDWIDRLRAQGYGAAIAHGWDEAREIIFKYFS